MKLITLCVLVLLQHSIVELNITRIIRTTIVARLPFQVSLIFKKDNNEYQHFCGGTLISLDIVLTAANCVDTNRTFRVLAGVTTFSNLKYYQLGVPKYQKIHSGYYSPDGKGYDNNIAVVKLSSKFNSTETVVPIPFRTTNTKPGEKCYISGWGYRCVKTPKYSDSMMMTSVYIANREDCVKLFASKFTEKMLCVSSELKDACNEDSGGPLVCENQLTGIISFGANDYDIKNPTNVYTEVAKYESFIAEASSSQNIYKTRQVILLNLTIMICIIMIKSIIYL